jgi:hypothetical protein
MNLMEMIQSLHHEKEILDRAIATLERVHQRSRPLPHLSPGRRRGRKSMRVEKFNGTRHGNEGSV